MFWSKHVARVQGGIVAHVYSVQDLTDLLSLTWRDLLSIGLCNVWRTIKEA